MIGLSRLQRVGRKKAYKAPEGLIRQKGSPYWWIKLTYNGERIKKSTRVPLDNLTKATIILREVQKRILEKEDKAKEILGESITFTQLAKRYLKEVSPGKRSAKSDEVNSKRPVEKIGTWRIDGIKPKHIYEYMDWRKTIISERKRKRVSGATINREKAFISACFKKAIRWGYIEMNPCDGIEGEEESKRTRYITDAELNGIKEKARTNPKAHHLPDILDALYNTGLREGRVLTLEWKQVNLETRMIGFEEIVENKKVPRWVWINDRLMEVLTRLKRERPLQKVVGPYVFQKIDGSRYQSIKTAWRTSCREAKVFNVRIHDIRHKTATDLGEMGFTPQQIALVLGHSNTSTTDGYTHLQSTKPMLQALGK